MPVPENARLAAQHITRILDRVNPCRSVIGKLRASIVVNPLATNGIEKISWHVADL